MATIATLFFLSVLAYAVQPAPEITPVVQIITAIIGFLFAAAAYWLLRKTVPVRIRPCPKCGSDQRRPAGVLTRRRSLFLRHIGGFLLETFWGQSQRQQVACASCENLYFTETKSTRAWGVAAWVFLLLLLIGALANHFLPDK